MTVKEYVNQFNQLARFGLDLVNTQHKKALRFVKGLNEPLHSLAMTHVPMGATYEKLVDMALLHEEDKGPKETKKEEPQNKKAGPKKEHKRRMRSLKIRRGKVLYLWELDSSEQGLQKKEGHLPVSYTHLTLPTTERV